MPRKQPPKIDVPEGIIEKDLTYPAGKDRLVFTAGEHGCLRFYKTVTFGWCMATLAIKRGRHGSDRTYGVRLEDGAGVRVGNGPHVKAQVTVYVRESRLKALQRYIDMYAEGLEKANVTRDRISSRRMQGALERAAGKRSWRWDV